MKAIVIFDSRYGNTEKIASDIAKGLQQNQIEVICCKTIEVDVEKLGNYNLIAIGGPTEMHRASAPMRVFLSELKHVDLKGKYGFAFDTKLSSRWAGDASDSIEHALKATGARILMPRTSAFVNRPPKEELQPVGETTDETREEKKARKSEGKEIKRAAAILEEGMEGKFEQIGLELGLELVKVHTSSQVVV